MARLFDNFNALVLLIQAMGAGLIGLLCLLLGRVDRRSALRAWTRGWLSLAGALLALLWEQASPPSAPLTLPLYLFGENLFGFWIIEGCAHFGGRAWSDRLLRRLLVPLAVASFAVPQCIGYDFLNVFMLQASVLAAVFATALLMLSASPRRVLPSAGLLVIRASLAMLTVLFASYLPILGAHLWRQVPLPTTLLALSSAVHLVLEFLLGFGGAVLILEQSYHGALGRNQLLTVDLEQLRGQAERDALTNAYNRHALMQRLNDSLSHAASRGSRLTLLYIDVDHFKAINDRHGHTVGDRLLIELARRLQKCLSEDEFVVRMGGDEFVVITPHLRDRDEMASLASRIRSSVNEPLVLDAVSVAVQISVGIAAYPDDAATAQLLLQHADVALYQAKAGGRNNYCFFDAQMNANAQENAQLVQALATAIESNQLFLEYQPLVDLPSKRVIALEALARWRHPQRGLISPAIFIALAEQNGMIHQIGEWVLRRVCEQLRSWQVEHLSVIPISVNVSPRQFEQGRLADTVLQVIQEYGIDPTLIHIEITESALMKNVLQHAATLLKLREAGISVSIDDFGTGYSSLSYLTQLPIDCLKIDRSFIANMASDPRDSAVVRAVVGIAQSMNLVVVAEGVERAEQAHELLRMGCVAGQGYLFYPPLAAADCHSLLQQLARDVPKRDTLQLRLLRWVRKSGTA
jgi:diguanylate cyclase (GGDEF)-like protein